MKLSYVTTDDATDVLAWSGLRYYIAQSLISQGAILEYIGKLAQKPSWQVSLKSLIFYRILHKRYPLDREPIVVKEYARQVAQRISRSNSDFVFSPGSVPVAYLDCKQPIAFWTDATFAGMVEFYPEYSHLFWETIRNGNTIEQNALSRCRLAIYASDWAAQTAITNYRVDPTKVHVVPFGANLDVNYKLDDIKQMVQSRGHDCCKLLFLGVDWVRKGGTVALAVAKMLNQAGLPTELTVVGCKPLGEEPLPNFVHLLGFISKATAEGRQRLQQLLAESHFLILPSRAEAYGVVFCEANAFGVPCLATDVGGIPTIIKNGRNGRTFPLDAPIEEYCTYVMDLFRNHQTYEQLALSSFHEYQSRLNWSVAGQRVKHLLEEVIRK